MQKPKILITAASGKTGTATALQLLQKGYPVRALVHRIDPRSERLKQAGAEVVCGSLEDWVDVRTHLTGVQRAYFCPPLEYGTLRRATLFALAAQEAKLEAVVALSQWLTDPLHPSIHAREKWLSEQVFGRMPDLGVITINPGFFADNYMAGLEALAQFGLLGMPLGEGLNAPPSNEDIARVIVAALLNPAPHIGKSYRPTGPKLLTPQEIATVFGKVLGRTVKYQPVPLKLFLKIAKALNVSDFVICQLYWFLQDYQRNAFGIGAPTEVVREMGGAPPEDFEQIVRRYVVGSPVAKPTVTAKLRASLNLVKALITPASDPEAIARRLEIPPLAHATLAADSSTWRKTHL